MSRTTNCYANAIIESFWATLKTEWTTNHIAHAPRRVPSFFFSSKALSSSPLFRRIITPITRGSIPMTSEISAKADFSIIRYAQCWEDADILLEALSVEPQHV